MGLEEKCLKKLSRGEDNIEKKLRNTGLGKEMVYVTNASMACFFCLGFLWFNCDLENFPSGILYAVQIKLIATVFF